MDKGKVYEMGRASVGYHTITSGSLLQVRYGIIKTDYTYMRIIKIINRSGNCYINMEKILVAVKNKKKSKMIRELLKYNYDIYNYSDNIGINLSFDLTIVDIKTLASFKTKNICFKCDPNTVFMPVLLISSKKGIPSISDDTWSIIDEIVTTPIDKMELFAAVEILTLTRRQSIQLCRQRSPLSDDKTIALKHDDILTDYFSNVSHELRTPLSVILSSIDFLSACVVEKFIKPETCINALDISKRNCHRLLRVVNNLLDIAKIDSGCMKLSLVNSNIKNIMDDIIDSVQSYAERKGITLNFFSYTMHDTIALDEDMLERIMLNLLSNAIKFTPPEGIISVILQDSQDPNKIIISVKDTGIGIPVEKQQTIFDRFEQADDSLSKRTEGCGLGLSLVKSMIELHGGSIWVDSKAGIGTKFSFELPARIISFADLHQRLSADITDRICYEFSDF